MRLFERVHDATWAPVKRATLFIHGTSVRLGVNSMWHAKDAPAQPPFNLCLNLFVRSGDFVAHGESQAQTSPVRNE